MVWCLVLNGMTGIHTSSILYRFLPPTLPRHLENDSKIQGLAEKMRRIKQFCKLFVTSLFKIPAVCLCIMFCSWRKVKFFISPKLFIRLLDLCHSFCLSRYQTGVKSCTDCTVYSVRVHNNPIYNVLYM